jgi:peroxiredoxin
MTTLKPLEAGTVAPDFELKSTPDQSVRLQELRGKNVVLVFYPADWSPVCSDQLGLYQQLMPEFDKLDAEIVGISVDGIWSHIAFAKDRNLHFPLLSDFNPRGAVASAYGVFDEKLGTSGRALFVVDEDGKIAWSYLSPAGVNPGADGILDALQMLHEQAVVS